MRYYTSHLLAATNSCIKEERIAADREWSEADKAYRKQWEQVKKRLPPKFVELYEKSGLHDGEITQCVFEYNNKIPIVKMHLYLDVERIELRFLNVKSYCANFIDFSACILHQLAWGYDEFEYLPSHEFKLSVLCDIKNELEIVFKKLEWELLE